MVKKKPTAETLTESEIGRLIQAYGWPRHHPHRGVKNNCQRMPPVFHHVRPINSWHEGPPPPRREIEGPARWTLPKKNSDKRVSEPEIPTLLTPSPSAAGQIPINAALKVRVFPSREALLRLVTAILVEIDEEWAASPRSIMPTGSSTVASALAKIANPLCP
jgi:hypothetical protein